MPKKHISVAKSLFIWFIAVVFILIGFASMSTGETAGFSLVILGFAIAIVNKLVFKIRTKQLEIDAREAVRDKIGYVYPNCGQRMLETSKFCNNCGYKIK